MAILELEQKIIYLESKLAKYESTLSPKERIKKKMRRKAKEISRTYTVKYWLIQCEINSCGRVYGSETSLKNHRKIKHGIRLVRRSKLREAHSLGTAKHPKEE